MAVCSLSFLLFCGAVGIVFHLAPGKRPRQFILACTSALFLASLVPDLRSWEWFAALLAGTFVALVAVRAWGHGAVVAAGISFVVVVYLYLKRYAFLASFIPFPLAWELRLHPVEVVGLSYMIFKFIQMLVDQWQGQLARFNLWTYLNYQLSFFTLTAGPIQRYNDFLRYWEEMDLGPSDTRDSLLLWIRILMGMIKVGLLGAYADQICRYANDAHQVPTLSDALLSFYVYPMYLYFNFSGYTDIMLGAGGLLGFRLPENFNRPWLARNVLDFWDRWHITLTHWIRDYVFMTSYKIAATQFPRGARYWSYALLFLALFVAGIWHGATDGFFVFGALNGLGAAITRAYGDVLRAALGRQRLHAYLKNPTVRLIAVVVTLHYVCLCQLFFALDVERALEILAAAGSEIAHLPTTLSSYAWQGPAVAGLLGAMSLALLWKSDLVASVLERVTLRVGRRTGWLYTILCMQCVFVAGMLFVDWALQQEPPPVLYMAF
jgi:alginate O-acetyltransferase complex protein AlgI